MCGNIKRLRQCWKAFLDIMLGFHVPFQLPCPLKEREEAKEGAV